MKKQKENYFVDKFRLLDSQETSEEISWSYSDSSDYENYTPSGKFNITYGKRKKGNRKRNEMRNISNLDITIIDAINERKSRSKSPILVAKSKSEIKSPILTPSQLSLPRFKTTKTSHCSPVPYNHMNVCKERRNLKSPILLERESPVISPKVKKKLFETAHPPLNSGNLNLRIRSTSPVFNSNLHLLDRRKSTIKPIEQLWENNTSIQADEFRITERFKNLNKEQNIPNLKSDWKKTSTNQSHSYRTERIKSPNEEQYSCYFNDEQKKSRFEISIPSSSSDSANISREELVSKVNSYFDNYFSSQTSNHSISEYETPTSKSSKSSEEIENINDITQVKSLSPSLKDTQTATSFGSNTNTIKQKVKYKRGALAYRLNELIKKQNANISLWQHERFLAKNSNFLIPKEESLAFRIKNVDFSYSIYSIEVVNEDDERFLIVINSTYVNNNQFLIENILKLYKPYNIIESVNNSKIIVNVCKFECRKFI